ncbi:MAG: 30S ribosomal protein S19e [Methanobacteriota archaeon]|nr:MAG: 30S ribosomal protein S19e [Euryarchaeota archaeon]
MVTAYDVEANKLIDAVAEKLKSAIKKPDFVDLVKSGPHVQRPPEQEDFFFKRAASILRKSYLYGVLGVNRLRRAYGGRKNRGLRPEHKVKAGGKIIREAFKELEKAGLLEKVENGRRITPKGVALLDNTAKEVANV